MRRINHARGGIGRSLRLTSFRTMSAGTEDRPSAKRLREELDQARTPRWMLSKEGRARLEEVYTAHSFPSLAIREQLSEELGGTMRQVQVWFQNRRQRDQRAGQMNQLMMRQEGFKTMVPPPAYGHVLPAGAYPAAAHIHAPPVHPGAAGYIFAYPPHDAHLMPGGMQPTICVQPTPMLQPYLYCHQAVPSPYPHPYHQAMPPEALSYAHPSAHQAEHARAAVPAGPTAHMSFQAACDSAVRSEAAYQACVEQLEGAPAGSNPGAAPHRPEESLRARENGSTPFAVPPPLCPYWSTSSPATEAQHAAAAADTRLQANAHSEERKDLRKEQAAPYARESATIEKTDAMTTGGAFPPGAQLLAALPHQGVKRPRDS